LFGCLADWGQIGRGNSDVPATCVEARCTIRFGLLTIATDSRHCRSSVQAAKNFILRSRGITVRETIDKLKNGECLRVPVQK
jgi:hypothetical protein